MKATKDIAKTIKAASKEKTSGYDTRAKVVRVEGGTAWVHIPGGVDETPVRLTMDAKPGDAVQVRVAGGRAWLTGNATAPPTDDTVANVAINYAATAQNDAARAFNVAETAQYTAAAAGTLANNAMISANGKNKVYRQAAEPAGDTFAVGDIWFDTSNDNQINRWDGSAWVAFTLGDDALGSLSASKITAGEIDASVITVSNLDAGNITTGTLAAERIGAGTITIGKMDSTAQSQILNSEITVGGRNYLKTNESFGYTTTGGGVTAVITGPSAFTFNGTATDTNIAFTDTKAFGGVELEAGEYMLSITPQTTNIRLRVGKGDSSTYLGLYDSPAQISITEADTYYVVPARISGKTYSASTEYKIKLEKGTKATDWTPAIEDVEKYTDDVASTLSDSLNSSISETASELTDKIESVRTLAGSKADATALSDLSLQMQEYIGEGGYIYASNGTLIIATGQNVGNFKIGLTGQQIVFYENDIAVAYIEGKRLYISRSEVTDEQKISNFAFKKRDDGRFTLMYVGS